MARQRLRGLVGTYPHRLDLREQLAELYRRDGIPSQAGRWSFLSETRDSAELRAFEREYPDPIRRMRAVGWRGAEDVAGDSVRDRLGALREEAEMKAGHPVSWERVATERTPSSWGERLFALLAMLVFGLVLLGGVAFLIEGIKTVVAWLGG
jgi:hypothetical protein